MLFLEKSRVFLSLQNESIERGVNLIYNTMESHINKYLFRRVKNKLIKRFRQQFCWCT